LTQVNIGNGEIMRATIKFKLGATFAIVLTLLLGMAALAASKLSEMNSVTT